MRPKTLGLIHTSAALVPVFEKLCRELLDGIHRFNIVDDSLIKRCIEAGELTTHTARRVVDYVGSAEAAGADYILVTCSSIGAAVEAAEPFTSVPVLRVDRPMVDAAVRSGSRIGVVATLSSTLEPTRDLIKRRAAAAGKDIEPAAMLCNGAFAALMDGDADRHDAMVGEALKSLSAHVDIILLAQASMARVLDRLGDTLPVPVLSSPRQAIEHLASELL